MELVPVLLENDGIQAYLSENEGSIVDAAKVFAEYPQIVKDHINENLKDFIVPNDMTATYENMVVFVESACAQFLTELTKMISEGQSVTE